MQYEQSTIDIEKWKLKRLINSLENIQGHGTSMISILIPPKKQISDINKLLVEENGKASNIKSRVNRLSVQSAITSTQQVLKQYNRIPENGMALFCGTYLNDENKEKMIKKVIEPYKPISSFLYKCDDKFHVDSLKYLIEDNETFGFIIVDGSGTLFGTISGSTKTTLRRFDVSLPSKHNKGGQSSVRFRRLYDEAKHNYVRKVAENATEVFITNNQVNVKGIILAGFASFKDVLNKSDLFDPRLKAKIIKIVDIQYGGDTGFNEAINLAQDALEDVKIIKEKKLISDFMEAIAKDNGKVIFGINETMEAVKVGAVDKLLIWNNLSLIRISYLLNDTEYNYYLDPNNKTHKEQFDKIQNENGFKLLDSLPLLDWLMEYYHKFGIQLEIISDSTSIGYQFVKGFGGMGGLLRYKFDINIGNEFDINNDTFDDFI